VKKQHHDALDEPSSHFPAHQFSIVSMRALGPDGKRQNTKREAPRQSCPNQSSALHPTSSALRRSSLPQNPQQFPGIPVGKILIQRDEETALPKLFFAKLPKGPKPYAPHPTPYAPHPTPCVLRPTPYALNPTPHTLHPTPTPYTPHPTPYTLHPEPCTLNPTPESQTSTSKGSSREGHPEQN
jgi:hypothetical protein